MYVRDCFNGKFKVDFVRKKIIIASHSFSGTLYKSIENSTVDEVLCLEFLRVHLVYALVSVVVHVELT